MLQFHRDLLKYVGDVGGHWKISSNEIRETLPDGTKRTRFEPLAPHLTEDAMRVLHENFRDALHDGTWDPLFLIPFYILDFLCIHPFADGNGRMAACFPCWRSTTRAMRLGDTSAWNALSRRPRSPTMKPCTSRHGVGTRTNMTCGRGRNTSWARSLLPMPSLRTVSNAPVPAGATKPIQSNTPSKPSSRTSASPTSKKPARWSAAT
ncbi:MAG: Fic family protein [Verrucomicrobiota bacterium]